MRKCVNPACGVELDDGVKFCPECGTKQPAAVPAETAGAGGVAIGGHAVIAGDVVSHVTNTSYVTHADATKEVVACAVCGRRLVVTETFVCPVCGKSVCEGHFDHEHRICRVCRDQQCRSAETAFRQAIRDELKSVGRIDEAAVVRLVEKRRSLGLEESRGREILAEERTAGTAARPSAEHEEARRRVLDRAADLLYREGKCADVALLLGPMVDAEGGSLDEEAREILLTALLTEYPAQGDKIVETTLVDSRSASLYRIDRCIKLGDLGPVGRLVDEAEKKWPGDALVACRRALLDCVLFEKLQDKVYLDKADAVLNAVKEATRPVEAAWLKYVRNFVALLRGAETVSVAEGGPFHALLHGQLTESPRGPTCAFFANRQFELAEKYYFGNGVEQSYEIALRHCREAAEKGNFGAQKMLGVMYECGKGVQQSYAKAAEWYAKAVEGGEHDAECFLGLLYEKGRGVKLSYAEAESLYRRAAEAGHRMAQNLLGHMYYHGLGLAVSYPEAVRWYRKSAAQGFPSAMFNLGVAYEFGKGVPQSYEEAAKWYRQGADAGDADAQAYLAALYEKGLGVEKSLKDAYELYLAAADKGSLLAQNNLGVMYEVGNHVEQSYAEAAKWYRKAADGGYACAQCNLGVLYDYGRGVQQSLEDAAKWYRKSAEQGYSRAECNYGYMLECGRGVCQSLSGAVDWYHRSAEQGYARAQGNLAYMYETGRGIRQSDAEAVSWYRKAVEQGEARSQSALGGMYLDGAGVGKSYSEALRLCRLAADQAFPHAWFQLGIMYENGYGVDKSLDEAKRWYEKASAADDRDAKAALFRLLPSPSANRDGGSSTASKMSPMAVLLWTEIAAMSVTGVIALCTGHWVVALAILIADIATGLSYDKNRFSEWRWILPCPLAVAGAVFGMMGNWIVSAALFLSICWIIKED